jgi:hypothetical protein
LGSLESSHAWMSARCRLLKFTSPVVGVLMLRLYRMAHVDSESAGLCAGIGRFRGQHHGLWSQPQWSFVDASMWLMLPPGSQIELMVCRTIVGVRPLL